MAQEQALGDLKLDRVLADAEVQRLRQLHDDLLIAVRRIKRELIKREREISDALR